MDWEFLAELIDGLHQGVAPIHFGECLPTPSAVLGAKIALRLLQSEGATLNPPPDVLATPWGSIVIWWRTATPRRIEILSRDEAYEFVGSSGQLKIRRFMSGPPTDDAPMR